ncbi:ArsB/NhaD family transporter [Sphaerisporangium rubeum]|uniref:Na+/H+ antiporter NhaD/arsenite permease-like protein n=1 Tax=Sphaerisporangium rubeum TaxID=321317 RepID=A0A7X0IFZ2_9ACTN|nr:SLC13 family permease [Sphaerisporangium rubeum]MBB6474442.1 Na+/H+ antiporter NhaD/arsenite permease-like protein [Sphaerisporangium rubeum]
MRRRHSESRFRARRRTRTEARIADAPSSGGPPDTGPTSSSGLTPHTGGTQGTTPDARRPTVLDMARLAVLVAGLLCVVTGVLPWREAVADVGRVGPLLVFLVAVIVFAELVKEADVFDVLAARIAIVARGRYWALFALCVAFAAVITMLLNLDTTAVLLTPVLLVLAARTGIPALPLAMTTIWLANTASLLLPVSNLTNLLAEARLGLSTHGFAARMWAPQVAALAVTALLLWIFFWRRGARGAQDRYRPPSPVSVRDRVLFRTGTVVCVLFAVAVLAGAPIAEVAVASAVVLVAAFAWRDRSRLTFSLVPWQLAAFVIGLFLVVPALSRYGLDEVTRALAGDGGYRTAAAGAGLANVVNNLPAYYAGERVVPPGGRDALLTLLIGVNVGSVITPWASVATLLWFETCRRHGVRVPPSKFVITGACLAVTAVTAAVAALILTAGP